jgi:carboxylesterase type B
VYAPTDAKKLPVYIYIQGGGFNSNSNSNYNGSGLITASGLNVVIVNFNYRVGLYGFLASKEVKEDGDLNNGLKDQRKVFEWVQKYIHKVELHLHPFSRKLTER